MRQLEAIRAEIGVPTRVPELLTISPSPANRGNAYSMPEMLYGPGRPRRKSAFHRTSRYQFVVYVAVSSLVVLAVVAFLGIPRPRTPQRQPSRGVSTGNGDYLVFTVPIDIEPGRAVCRQGNQSVVSAARLPIVAPDSEMRRVGTCTGPDLNLYSRQDMPALLYVKTDIYRYLAVRQQTVDTKRKHTARTSGSTSDR